MRFRQLLPLFGALFALYIIWGSTYFVIRIGVESWPPLMMAGVRFLAAGILLLAFLLLRGHKLPPLRPLLNAALIGLLLLAVGNGMVTVAEHQNVPSGIAAVVVATVPLFTLCFSRLFGIKTRKLEWVGIAIGLAGIIMLNSGGNLSGNPWGAILILIGSISWAFGSVYGSRITLPVGMMAGAIEMLAAGVVLMIASMIAGEKLTALPSLSGFLAVGYLALFGSVTPDAAGVRSLGETLKDVMEPEKAENLAAIMDSVNSIATSQFDIIFDPTLVRGMSYYTGTIYEIQVDGFPGSVGGGGRYDKMIGKFTGMETPACGFSIGFERIITILMEEGFTIPGSTEKKAFLIEKGVSAEVMTAAIKEAMDERARGVSVLVSQMNKNKKFQKENLQKEGYTEFKEFYREGLK